MPLAIAAIAANNATPTIICLIVGRKELIWTALPKPSEDETLRCWIAHGRE